MKLKGPKFQSYSSGLQPPPLCINTGSTDMECHIVLGFPRPGKFGEYFILDMARMQYGEAGRGGTFDEFINSMKKICGEIILQPTQPPPPFFGTKGIHEAKLTACVKKAWKRW
jgi:hypothetical protein